MPFLETAQRIGDAFAGVDREAAFRKGQYERAQYDTQLSMQSENEAQAQAAMATASERQKEAEIKESIRQARERVEQNARQFLSYGNPNVAADVALAGMGPDYAATMLGQERIQGNKLRDLVANPMVGDQMREPALEALAPGSAVTARYGDPAVEMVMGPNGKPVWALRKNAPGQLVGYRPDDPSNGSGSGDGMFESADMNTLKSLVVWQYGGFMHPQTGEIIGIDPTVKPEALYVASRAAQIMQTYRVDHGTAVRAAMDEVKAGGMRTLQLPPPVSQPGTQMGAPPTAAPTAAPAAAPTAGNDLTAFTNLQPGFVDPDSGLRFVGGDPESQAAWQPVQAAPAAPAAAPVLALPPPAPAAEAPPPAVDVGAQLVEPPKVEGPRERYSFRGETPGAAKRRRAAEEAEAAKPTAEQAQAQTLQASIDGLLSQYGGDINAAPPHVQQAVYILMAQMQGNG
jgi:hypothetical protein